MLNIAILLIFCHFNTSIWMDRNVEPMHMLYESNNDLEQLKKYAAYNTWANQQLAQWLSKADSLQWHKEINSSFSTLELTLRHLWNAEYGWLCTLKNIPWESAIDRGEVMPQDQMLKEFINTSMEFQGFVESMTASKLLETRNLGKDERATALADIVLHVFNHATYHRGQLITMGRQVGLLSPRRTDYIHFISK